LRTAFLIALVVLCHTTGAQAQAWDLSPFRSPTPVPQDGLPRDQGAFLSWLDRSTASFSQEEHQAINEHLYAYISALAKERHGQFPSQMDTTAFNLFRAAARLGVTGADRVARALFPHPEQFPSPTSVPGFILTLTPPLFTLASDDRSWGVCYPYYFMAAPAGRQRPSNGVLTELVILSTLFAPDQGAAGSSQATILIAAAPVADSAKHVAMWITQLAVTPSAAPKEDPSGVWFVSPPTDSMHRLLVIRRLPQRVLIITYLGLGGTFEVNRPHFFNLLATIGSGHCAA